MTYGQYNYLSKMYSNFSGEAIVTNFVEFINVSYFLKVGISKLVNCFLLVYRISHLDCRM